MSYDTSSKTSEADGGAASPRVTDRDMRVAIAVRDAFVFGINVRGYLRTESEHYEAGKEIFNMMESFDLAKLIGDKVPATAEQSSTPGSNTCAEMRALCSACGGTGDVHGLDGEWRGRCDCEASAWSRAALLAQQREAGRREAIDEMDRKWVEHNEAQINLKALAPLGKEAIESERALFEAFYRERAGHECKTELHRDPIEFGETGEYTRTFTHCDFEVWKGRAFARALLAASPKVEPVNNELQAEQDYFDRRPDDLHPKVEPVSDDKRDAERYRKLCAHREILLLTGFFGNGCINRTLDEVDAAIDALAATASQPKPTKESK